MERNSIMVAPQFGDVEAAYTEWHKYHAGDREQFYRFMTSPTPEREAYLRMLDVAHLSQTGDVAPGMYKTEVL